MAVTTVELAAATRLPIYPQRSPYHLSEEQVRFFDEHGYLILRNWIPAPLLARQQRRGQRLDR